LNKPLHPIPQPRARVAVGRFSVRVPQSRSLRVSLGVALVIGGIFGFLPILGFWMIPLGLLVLSIDFHGSPLPPADDCPLGPAGIKGQAQASRRVTLTVEKERAGGLVRPQGIG